jgi:hypothetical protein
MNSTIPGCHRRFPNAFTAGHAACAAGSVHLGPETSVPQGVDQSAFHNSDHGSGGVGDGLLYAAHKWTWYQYVGID